MFTSIDKLWTLRIIHIMHLWQAKFVQREAGEGGVGEYFYCDIFQEGPTHTCLEPTAPVPGHQLAEDRAKRFEHVDLTIEATACGHEGS